MENQQNTENKSAYRSIFKATSLFGGVQLYKILIELIKSKFVAVLLGPTGVGISGLYNSGLSLVQQLTSFGLSASAVRNVSEAYGTGNQNRVNTVVTALRKLVWLTGLLGMFAVIVFSPVLSKTSFGDNLHIIGFVLISVTLLFSQLSAGQQVILQGTRKLKYLAKSSAIGVTIGLFISIPLYYFFGINGIVPNIIIGSLSALLLTWYFSRKVKVEKVPLTMKQIFKEGKTMLIMGVAMSLTAILSSASSFAIRGFIRSLDGVEAVGLFSLGFALTNQYTGLVFSAMSTDFYPRLSAVNNDNEKCTELVNRQNEIGTLIIAPMLAALIIFVPLVIRLLASEKFLPITEYMVWAAWGVFFKMTSWSIGYIFLAKAESRLFVITEIVSCVATLLFSIIGYSLGGLTGIGLASAAALAFYLLMVVLIVKKRYSFSFTRGFIKIASIQFILVSACVVVVYTLPTVIKYCVGVLIVGVCTCFSFVGLNERIDLRAILKRKKK